MDVTERAAPPPPGSARPGNLYADLQTRTLWLGVDPAVDPAQAVLISDIVSFYDDIADNLTASKAYTDQQVATRSPTGHKHVAADTTNFATAVQAVVSAMPGFAWIPKTIIMFSGSLAEIGVGNLAGWALCDGTNGTPDLRDKFVLGAGHRIVGSVNPQTTLVTDSKGSHQHTINGTSITVAQMPSHYHGGNTGYISHNHTHAFSANTGTESHDHQHYIGAGFNGSGISSNGGYIHQTNDNNGAISGGRTQAHYHYVSANTGYVDTNHYHAINAEGGNGSHTHTEQFAGDHTHNILSITLREAIPFYALAFIMKL